MKLVLLRIVGRQSVCLRHNSLVAWPSWWTLGRALHVLFPFPRTISQFIGQFKLHLQFTSFIREPLPSVFETTQHGANFDMYYCTSTSPGRMIFVQADAQWASPIHSLGLERGPNDQTRWILCLSHTVTVTQPTKRGKAFPVHCFHVTKMACNRT